MEANTAPADDRTNELRNETNETNYILLHYTTPISPAPEEATTMEANTAPADDITNELRNETKRNEMKLHIITLYYTYITPHAPEEAG